MIRDFIRAILSENTANRLKAANIDALFRDITQKFGGDFITGDNVPENYLETALFSVMNSNDEYIAYKSNIHGSKTFRQSISKSIIRIASREKRGGVTPDIYAIKLINAKNVAINDYIREELKQYDVIVIIITIAAIANTTINQVSYLQLKSFLKIAKDDKQFITLLSRMTKAT